MRQWSVALRNSHFFSQIKTFAFLLKINAEPRSTMSSISIHIPDLVNFIIFSNIYGANECDWLLFNAHSSKVLLRLFFFNSYGAGTEREKEKRMNYPKLNETAGECMHNIYIVGNFCCCRCCCFDIDLSCRQQHILSEPEGSYANQASGIHLYCGGFVMHVYLCAYRVKTIALSMYNECRTI